MPSRRATTGAGHRARAPCASRHPDGVRSLRAWKCPSLPRRGLSRPVHSRACQHGRPVVTGRSDKPSLTSGGGQPPPPSPGTPGRDGGEEEGQGGPGSPAAPVLAPFREVRERWWYRFLSGWAGHTGPQRVRGAEGSPGRGGGSCPKQTSSWLPRPVSLQEDEHWPQMA